MFAYPNSMVQDAYYFAMEAHSNQKRKYTGEPYIVHPVRVARSVIDVTDDPVVIAAALLHDVVEDTHYTIEDIAREFGSNVARIVADLTDPVVYGLNRATKIEAKLTHLKYARPDSQTVKLADIIDNVPSIAENDPTFAPLYIDEKVRALPLLRQGHPVLVGKAEMILASLLLRF